MWCRHRRLQAVIKQQEAEELTLWILYVMSFELGDNKTDNTLSILNYKTNPVTLTQLKVVVSANQIHPKNLFLLSFFLHITVAQHTKDIIIY